jgi:hypothetical protein
MDTALIVLVSLLVGGVVLAFYMDWLGLWVSKEEMREQIDRAKERRQALGKEIEDKACETAAQAKEGARIEASSKAVAFDLDAASMISLRKALPGWEIDVFNGATAASLSRDWNPGVANLLIVKAREDVAETLGLCRFLAFCSGYSRDFRQEVAGTLGPHRNEPNQEGRVDAPLLVLVSPGQETLVRAALEVGAYSCLMLPIHAEDVVSMLAHARAGNQPGRHTLNLERAQSEDRWRDDGGQG